MNKTKQSTTAIVWKQRRRIEGKRSTLARRWLSWVGRRSQSCVHRVSGSRGSGPLWSQQQHNLLALTRSRFMTSDQASAPSFSCRRLHRCLMRFLINGSSAVNCLMPLPPLMLLLANLFLIHLGKETRALGFEDKRLVWSVAPMLLMERAVVERMHPHLFPNHKVPRKQRGIH